MPEPSFTQPIENVTVPVGRETILSCSVQNLGGFKVSNSRKNFLSFDTQHEYLAAILLSAILFFKKMKLVMWVLKPKEIV